MIFKSFQHGLNGIDTLNTATALEKRWKKKWDICRETKMISGCMRSVSVPVPTAGKEIVVICLSSQHSRTFFTRDLVSDAECGPVTWMMKSHCRFPPLVTAGMSFWSGPTDENKVQSEPVCLPLSLCWWTFQVFWYLTSSPCFWHSCSTETPADLNMAPETPTRYSFVF